MESGSDGTFGRVYEKYERVNGNVLGKRSLIGFTGKVLYLV